MKGLFGKKISDLPDKEFKIMSQRIHTELRNRIEEQSENFNRENIRKYQLEVTKIKNSVTELKNIMEEFSSILDEGEERISELKYSGTQSRAE